MNFSSSMVMATGALQLIVAAYALRLNRLFGAARVGWSLCSAFSLLGLLHWVQSLTPLDVGRDSGIRLEVLYALISLLLFAGLAHLESLLKERMRLARQERELRAGLEAEVKKKTAYLQRAIEGLQAEMDERKRMESELKYLQPNNPGLFDSFAEMLREIPASALRRTLARESYMLELDCAHQRPLPLGDVGSILIFARFVSAGGTGERLPAPLVLPSVQVAFYRQTVERLIGAGELSPASKAAFDRLFAEAPMDRHDPVLVVPLWSQVFSAGQAVSLTR